MRKILVAVWYKLPLSAALRLRLGGFIRRGVGRAGAMGDIAIMTGSQNREWLHATMIANLKDKIVDLQGRLASFGGESEVRALRQRARDVEEYVRLGGREPPR